MNNTFQCLKCGNQRTIWRCTQCETADALQNISQSNSQSNNITVTKEELNDLNRTYQKWVEDGVIKDQPYNNNQSVLDYLYPYWFLLRVSIAIFITWYIFADRVFLHVPLYQIILEFLGLIIFCGGAFMYWPYVLMLFLILKFGVLILNSNF